MHTFEQIIKNQKKFKDEIMEFFHEEETSAKKTLDNIKTRDSYILKERKKLKNKYKNIKLKPYIEQLFFMNPNRNKKYYVWWDSEENEAKIFKYDKR